MWRVFGGSFKTVFSPSFTTNPPRFHHPKTTTIRPDFYKNPSKITICDRPKEIRATKPADNPMPPSKTNPHPTQYGIAGPTPGKANKLPQPSACLHHRWGHRSNFYHVSCPSPAVEHPRTPVPRPQKRSRADSIESALLRFVRMTLLGGGRNAVQSAVAIANAEQPQG